MSVTYGSATAIPVGGPTGPGSPPPCGQPQKPTMKYTHYSYPYASVTANGYQPCVVDFGLPWHTEVTNIG